MWVPVPITPWPLTNQLLRRSHLSLSDEAPTTKTALGTVDRPLVRELQRTTASRQPLLLPPPLASSCLQLSGAQSRNGTSG